MRLQKIAVRSVAVAALGLAVLGTPAVASAATPGPAVSGAAVAAPNPSLSQADLCQTVKTIAGPLLALVGAGLLPLNTALNLIASLTGVTVPQVLGCLV
ncbi:hypothetical protein [Streptosporangium sp. NPDC002524]|uniref:hypothetical protein n=1 Tax=Streptosporangium sp. NPDC002524 TaxID=3154537 RepID=UPI003328C749